MRYSQDKDLDRVVKSVVSEGWSVYRGGSHNIAVAPNGRRLPIPGSPNHHGAAMWKAQAKRLQRAACV